MTEHNVPPEHRPRIERLVDQNSDLFASTDADLGYASAIQMKIDTGNHPPMKMKPYRTPLNERKIVDKAIDDVIDSTLLEDQNHLGVSLLLWLIRKTVQKDSVLTKLQRLILGLYLSLLIYLTN